MLIVRVRRRDNAGEANARRLVASIDEVENQWILGLEDGEWKE